MCKFLEIPLVLAALLSMPSGVALAAVSDRAATVCPNGQLDSHCSSIDYQDLSPLNLRLSEYHASVTPAVFSASSIPLGDGNGGVLEGIGPTGTVTTIVVGAVPEPETGAMLLAGLGAMAMVMRRRRRR